MPTENPQQHVGFLMHDVARLLRKQFEQRARAFGMGFTRAHWSVLSHLSRHEGIHQAGLAEILEIEPISLVRLLDRLEGDGLVERRPDPRDRRTRRLYLTPAAHPVLTDMRALGAAVRQEALAGISRADQEKLVAALQVMKANLLQGDAEDAANG